MIGLYEFLVLCCDFRIKRCSVQLYLQLEASCFIYVICVCVHIVVSNSNFVVFLLCFSTSWVPYVAGVSGLSFF